MILQLFGAKVSEGVFIGAFLSMSSTAVVCSPDLHLILKLQMHVLYALYV